MKETLDENGISIIFTPAIPVCTDTRDEESRCILWGYSENHKIVLDIFGKEWLLAKYMKKENGTLVVLGKEESGDRIHQYECDNETIQAGNIGIGFWDYGYNDNGKRYFTLGSINGSKINLTEGDMIRYEDGYIKVSSEGMCTMIYCNLWVEVSSLSEVINLSDKANIVTLTWENESSWNPALKSIFIPQSSPIFEKLTGQ
ncbi:MAG: hypothetical protein ABH983_02460 [Candidatus Micrarchaeota archaeon]